MNPTKSIPPVEQLNIDPTPQSQLPPGWTVSTFRTEKECGTLVERGVGIRAEHEGGREFVLRLEEDLNPQPLDVVLPDGELLVSGPSYLGVVQRWDAWMAQR